MARNFRFYEKKRGNRSTGSKAVGRLGEALFFGALLGLGCGGLVLILVLLVIPEWRANHAFLEAPCVVLDKRVGRSEVGDGLRFRPEIRIQYDAAGTRHVIWTYDLRGAYSADEEAVQEVLAGFGPGQRRSCWYDPADPSVAVLQREISWWFWLWLVVPVCLLLIGGGGVVYTLCTWGKSAERRAAQAGQVPGLDVFEAIRRSDRPFPFVPAEKEITDSPGTVLAFRLPTARSPAWSVGIWLAACLLWNAVVAPFAVMVVNGFLSGRPDWFMTVFVSPFLLIGTAFVVVFVRQLLVAAGVGPTLVEISELPLYPGKSYELFLSQTGRLRMNSLEVFLVCDEEATYRHGTNVRTETHRVYRHPLLRQEAFQVRHGVPFEARCPLVVPAGVMHSFRSDHNEVRWKIVVRGDVAGWPDYERSFPLLVYPPGNGANHG